MEDFSQIEFESKFLATLLGSHAVVVPFLSAESYLESLDSTREFVLGIISRYSFERIGDKVTVANVRYTEEDGFHYWVRLMSRRIA